jgi:hypothetical protein
MPNSRLEADDLDIDDVLPDPPDANASALSPISRSRSAMDGARARSTLLEEGDTR